jgi:hypothetical protein
VLDFAFSMTFETCFVNAVKLFEVISLEFFVTVIHANLMTTTVSNLHIAYLCADWGRRRRSHHLSRLQNTCITSYRRRGQAACKKPYFVLWTMSAYTYIPVPNDSEG